MLFNHTNWSSFFSFCPCLILFPILLKPLSKHVYIRVFHNPPGQCLKWKMRDPYWLGSTQVLKLLFVLSTKSGTNILYPWHQITPNINSNLNTFELILNDDTQSLNGFYFLFKMEFNKSFKFDKNGQGFKFCFEGVESS